MLWATVGLVVIGVFGLGAAVWRHQKQEEADAARAAALANPPPAPVRPPAAAPPAASAAAATPTAVAAAEGDAQPAKAGLEAAGDAAKGAGAHRSRHHGSAKPHGKTLAKAGASPKVGKSSQKANDDTIDRLLSQMK